MVITGHRPHQHLNVPHIYQRMAWLMYFPPSPWDLTASAWEAEALSPRLALWRAVIVQRRICVMHLDCNACRSLPWLLFLLLGGNLKIVHFPSPPNLISSLTVPKAIAICLSVVAKRYQSWKAGGLESWIYVWLSMSLSLSYSPSLSFWVCDYNFV